MKKFILFLPLLFVGCAKAAEWLVENEETIEAAGDVAEATGPWGYIASAAAGLAVAGAKWYQQKITTKEIIEATQKAKNELPPESKKILADAYNVHMPSKVKKVVAKVKKSLE